MKKTKNAEKLLGLIEEGTSPFHVVEAATRQLADAGYEEMLLGEEWILERGGNYMMKHHGSSLFAFSIGSHFSQEDGFRLAAAHGDFPGFRIKPNPEVVTDGYIQLNVECYGGVNLSSWLDRPLSVAGRVVLKTEDIFHPEVRLVDIKRPILTIPNIAVHLEREMNKGVELNKQTHMLPVVAIGDGEITKDYFITFLASYMGIEKEQILEYELNLYNTDTGDLIGVKEEFVSAPRLDNLTSVQALLSGLIHGKRDKGINLIAIFDHEEIGSKTKQGADSTLLYMILEKCYLSLGMTAMDCKNAIMDSLLMSVDVSHALHPSYVQKYDLTNKNILNKGFAIKEACAQSYATDSEGIAIVQQICEAKGIPYQKFLNRSDVVGGGTLGSVASAMLPVRTVDLGVPLLAMHSSRELMGVEDFTSLMDYIEAYFSLS